MFTLGIVTSVIRLNHKFIRVQINSIQFNSLVSLGYIYCNNKMQFSIGSMAAKINNAYTKLKLTDKH